jgi:hypothetical protein
MFIITLIFRMIDATVAFLFVQTVALTILPELLLFILVFNGLIYRLFYSLFLLFAFRVV